MPIIGFRRLPNPGRGDRAGVAQALTAGDRHLDTAASYGNEEEVGRVINSSGFPRDDLFVTTKAGVFAGGSPRVELLRRRRIGIRG